FPPAEECRAGSARSYKRRRTSLVSGRPVCSDVRGPTTTPRRGLVDCSTGLRRDDTNGDSGRTAIAKACSCGIQPGDAAPDAIPQGLDAGIHHLLRILRADLEYLAITFFSDQEA